jgi:HSP20 family protein
MAEFFNFNDDAKTFFKTVSHLLNEIQPVQTHQLLADIYDDEHFYTIIIDVPGCQKQDIKAEILNDSKLLVTINKLTNFQKSISIIKERFVGTLKREFSLPNTIDQNSISAKYDNGILQIIFKKNIDIYNYKNIPII